MHAALFTIDEHSGTAIMLQGDLAPRRAVLVADTAPLHARWRRRMVAHGVPAQTVVFSGMQRAPRLASTADVVTRGSDAWR